MWGWLFLAVLVQKPDFRLKYCHGITHMISLDAHLDNYGSIGDIMNDTWRIYLLTQWTDDYIQYFWRSNPKLHRDFSIRLHTWYVWTQIWVYTGRLLTLWLLPKVAIFWPCIRAIIPHLNVSPLYPAHHTILPILNTPSLNHAQSTRIRIQPITDLHSNHE